MTAVTEAGELRDAAARVRDAGPTPCSDDGCHCVSDPNAMIAMAEWLDAAAVALDINVRTVDRWGMDYALTTARAINGDHS